MNSVERYIKFQEELSAAKRDYENNINAAIKEHDRIVNEMHTASKQIVCAEVDAEYERLRLEFTTAREEWLKFGASWNFMTSRQRKRHKAEYDRIMHALHNGFTHRNVMGNLRREAWNKQEEETWPLMKKVWMVLRTTELQLDEAYNATVARLTAEYERDANPAAEFLPPEILAILHA